MKDSKQLAKFALDSSCHGIKFIFGSDRSKATRIFWIIAFTLSVTAFGFYLRRSYVKWLIHPDISTNINHKFSTEIPFPAITACTPVFAKGNFANRTKFYEKWKNFSAQWQAEMTVEEENFMAACSQACNSMEFVLIGPHLQKISEFDIVNFINESFMEVNETMSFCAFKNSIDCTNIFNKVLTDRGFCYSFNMQGFNTIFNKRIIGNDFNSYKRKSILKSFSELEKIYIDDDQDEPNEWSIDNGFSKQHKLFTIPVAAERGTTLIFIMRIKESEIYNLCEKFHKNFTYYIHLPNEIITPFHQPINIQFGKRKSLKITAKLFKSTNELRILSPKTRDCYFENERQLKFFKTYSKAHCNYECMSNYTLETCGCVKFSMPRDANTRVCSTVNEVQCYIKVMLKWPIYDRNKTDLNEPCDCLKNCNDVVYSIKAEEETVFANYSGAYLSIQFDEQIIEVYEFFMTYKFQNFIADTGGLLGLFLGCSVLSVIELFYFAVIFVYKKLTKSSRINFDGGNNDDNIECSKITEGCLKKFKEIQHQLNQHQKLMIALQIQVKSLPYSKESRKNNENLQELSVGAFLNCHSKNINRDLLDVLNNIDEDLKKHRKILKMRPL